MISVFLTLFLLEPAPVFSQSIVSSFPVPFYRVQDLAVNPETNTIFIVSEQALWCIDGDTNTITASLPYDTNVISVGVNPVTNRIYVGVGKYPEAEIIVLDGQSLNQVASILMTKPHFPSDITVNTNDNKIYVTNSGMVSGAGIGRHVTIIDGSTNEIIKILDVGYYPGSLDFNPTTNRIYFTKSIFQGYVKVIDGSSDCIIASIRIPGYPNGPEDLAVNEATNKVLVTQDSWENIYSINGETNSFDCFIPLSTKRLGVNPLTNHVYALDYWNKLFYIIDGDNYSVIEEISIHPYRVDDLVVNAVTGRIYIYGTYGLDYRIIVIQDEVPVHTVQIDIKPGSSPNSINLGDQGLLPVAILGSMDFDVGEINPETVEIGGITLAKRGSAKAPKLAFSYEDVNSDGYLDMMTFFEVQTLVSDGTLTETTTGLEINAHLNDGRLIEGTDSVNIVNF